MANGVCVDGLFLGRDYYGCGINRYCVNLFRHWERITAGTTFRTQILVESLDSGERNGLNPRAGFDLIRCSALRARNGWDGTRFAKAARRLRADLFLMPSRGGWDRIRMIEAARRLKPDVLFMPAPERVYFKRLKLIVTVHDLIPLLFPGDSATREWNWLRGNYLSCLRKADLILTDSECSKADMAGRFGVPAERIVVIPLGFDSQTFSPLPEEAASRCDAPVRYGIDRPYILHVGRWQPRKNLHRLVRAFHSLDQRLQGCTFQLVLCGAREPEIDKLDELVRSLSLGGKVLFTGPIPDPDLVNLYQRASGFAMPSLYEGFGLPALEAMACGVPVMSSDRSSLPEVLGDAAIYFNPESEDDIATAMQKLCGDSALREQLIERGLARVRLFSWETCARATLAALQSI